MALANDDGYAIDHVDAVLKELTALVGVVGHQFDGGDAHAVAGKKKSKKASKKSKKASKKSKKASKKASKKKSKGGKKLIEAEENDLIEAGANPKMTIYRGLKDFSKCPSLQRMTDYFALDPVKAKLHIQFTGEVLNMHIDKLYDLDADPKKVIRKLRTLKEKFGDKSAKRLSKK